MDDELRSAWSRFILNFRLRHPDPLKELRVHIETTWNKTDPHYETEYSKLRKSTDPGTLLEFAASLGTEAGAKIQLGFLHKLLDNERIGHRINEMKWDVIDVSAASHCLLTSDWPADIALPHGLLALPIGPHLLFVAANNDHILKKVRTAKVAKAVAAVNMLVASRARRFVFAHDQSQTAFIARYMSKGMMMPPLWPSLGRSTQQN